MRPVVSAGTQGVSEARCPRLALASASLPQAQRHCDCVSCCGAAQQWVSMVTPRLVPRLQVFQKRKFSFPSKELFCQETQRHLPQPAPRLPANEPSLGSRVPAACPPGSYFRQQSALILPWMSSPIARPEQAPCCRIELTRRGAGLIVSPSLPPWSKRCFPQHPPTVWSPPSHPRVGQPLHLALAGSVWLSTPPCPCVPLQQVQGGMMLQPPATSPPLLAAASGSLHPSCASSLLSQRTWQSCEIG